MKNLLFILLFIPFIGLGQSIIIPVFANVNNQERVNYWENGQKLSEVQYFNEKRDGSCKYWYKTGQLMSSGLYKNGKMYGLLFLIMKMVKYRVKEIIIIMNQIFTAERMGFRNITMKMVK